MIGLLATMIRNVRLHVIEQIKGQCKLGRKPFLQVIIDLTSLEKMDKNQPSKI